MSTRHDEYCILWQHELKFKALSSQTQNSLPRSTFVSVRHSSVWNLFRRPVKAWSLQYTVLFLLIKEQKSTNAILFDDCFISQIIIKQFQSSSESSNIILLAIKPNKRHFKYYWNSFVLSKCTINCAFVRYLSDFVSSLIPYFGRLMYAKRTEADHGLYGLFWWL